MQTPAQIEIDGILKSISHPDTQAATLAFLNVSTKLALIGGRAQLVMPPNTESDVPLPLKAAFNPQPNTQVPSPEDMLKDASYVETVIEARARLLKTLGPFSTRDICQRAEVAAHLVGQACALLGDHATAHRLFEAKKDANSFRLIVSEDKGLYTPSGRQ